MAKIITEKVNPALCVPCQFVIYYCDEEPGRKIRCKRPSVVRARIDARSTHNGVPIISKWFYNLCASHAGIADEQDEESEAAKDFLLSFGHALLEAITEKEKNG